ncbi:MAG: GIY-YIG nuclease family protein [Patescibacteria group bacterium]|nr:GIY-YIG nuclease family protein [Patescibacteria group bacterium]
MFFVYAIQSLKDGKLYIGISQNPQKRLKQHNSGMTPSTKGRRPFILVFEEACENRLEARQKEKFYKSGYGRELLKLKIQQRNSIGTCLPAGRE